MCEMREEASQMMTLMICVCVCEMKDVVRCEGVCEM